MLLPRINMRWPHGSGERIVVKSWLSFSGLRDSRGQNGDTILKRKKATLLSRI